MRKFSPHLSIGIRWRKERWMGGFPPHLSISIRWREQMWMGGFPHIFSSVSYRGKEGGWGDSRTPLRSIRWPERWWTGGIPPTCLRKNPYIYISVYDGGKKVDWGIPPTTLNQNQMGETYLSVLCCEKERVIAVSLRETAIMRDFFSNPPSWGDNLTTILTSAWLKI